MAASGISDAAVCHLPGGVAVDSRDTRANQFAGDSVGCADFNSLPLLSLRGEDRDYYTSLPTLNVQSVFHGNVNNVVISGAAVFRFLELSSF
jgi:hypothetical protein